MLLKQELLGKLKQDFGLNIYEVKIWIVLLSRGIATAGELAELSGVPRSRCYDVLESLEKKGFTVMKIGKPIKYIAVHPEEVLERVKREIGGNAELSLRMINDIKDTDVFKELQLLHKTGIEKVDGSEISNAFIGREHINHFLKYMVEGAEKSVLIATTGEGFTRKVNLLHKIINKAAKRGIKTKIIAPVNEKIAKKVKNNAELVDKDVNGRFVIVDDSQLLFMTNNGSTEKNYDCGVWVKSDFFTKALKQMIESSLYSK